MRAEFRDGSVSADADGGRLYDITDETHMVAPACFEAVADGRDLAAAARQQEPSTLHSRSHRQPLRVRHYGLAVEASDSGFE